MSQIFDALHESQGGRAGGTSRKFPTAKELLQTIEQDTGSYPEGQKPAGELICRENLQRFPVAKISIPASSRLVCFSRTDSLPAEKFRFLATRLRHLQQKRALKRIVITSSVPAEGKTMVAANLACALAAGKQSVLLVEGDLRRPSLGRHLGLADGPGLIELLQGNANGFNNILLLKGQGFCILPAGDVPTNPLELMQSGRPGECLDSAAAGFDWVVIDTPPILPLADTTIWMRLADAIMLVTRPGTTTKSQLQRSLEAMEQAKLLGAVVNASAEATANKYYYHYARTSAAIPIKSSAAR
jgi:capsular exopolysaccharide synthesis family protein